VADVACVIRRAEIHHLASSLPYRQSQPFFREKGATVLAIGLMNNTWQFIFYAIALVLFIAAGIGLKPGGERASLIGLGLAMFVVPTFWDRLALL
jgi:hypothetical protein